MKRRILAAALSAVLAAAAAAQDAGIEKPEAAPKAVAWEFAASLYGYFPPDDRHYAQPTVIANRGPIHLEARVNYEGFQTGSLWVGWNFGAGEKLHLDATLIAGGVFGETQGVAPGYELTLSYGRFELYSEGEYLFDLNHSSGNYFYNWAQLGYSPLEWLKAGLVSQRTRAYRTDLDIQRGLFVGLSYKNVTLTTFVFNLGWESPTVVLSLAMTF